MWTSLLAGHARRLEISAPPLRTGPSCSDVLGQIFPVFENRRWDREYVLLFYCIWTVYEYIQLIYSRSIYSVYTAYIQENPGTRQARLGDCVGGGGVLRAAAARILSGVLLGVAPCPLRGAAPPTASPRQEFVLEIRGGPGGYSGGGDLGGAGRGSRRCGVAGGDHHFSMLTKVDHVSAELGEVLHAR